MSCESYDWKSYALGELDRPARSTAEAHLGACPACREELAGLRVTLDALSTLRDEEIPRRIAFVSDQIFEPKWYTRAFHSLWSPNFAAACVIAAAILVHAFHAPAQALSAPLVTAQIDAAVSKAVAAVEARDDEKIDRMVQFYTNRDSALYAQAVGYVRQ